MGTSWSETWTRGCPPLPCAGRTPRCLSDAVGPSLRRGRQFAKASAHRVGGCQRGGRGVHCFPGAAGGGVKGQPRGGSWGSTPLPHRTPSRRAANFLKKKPHPNCLPEISQTTRRNRLAGCTGAACKLTCPRAASTFLDIHPPLHPPGCITTTPFAAQVPRRQDRICDLEDGGTPRTQNSIQNASQNWESRTFIGKRRVASTQPQSFRSRHGDASDRGGHIQRHTGFQSQTAAPIAGSRGRN